MLRCEPARKARIGFPRVRLLRRDALAGSHTANQRIGPPCCLTRQGRALCTDPGLIRAPAARHTGGLWAEFGSLPPEAVLARPKRSAFASNSSPCSNSVTSSPPESVSKSNRFRRTTPPCNSGWQVNWVIRALHPQYAGIMFPTRVSSSLIGSICNCQGGPIPT